MPHAGSAVRRRARDPAMYEVKLPQWGMDMTEGTVVKWHKQEGEHVAQHEPLAEIEIAKAVNTLESPVAGILVKHVAALEDTVPVQAVLALIDEQA